MDIGTPLIDGLHQGFIWVGGGVYFLPSLYLIQVCSGSVLNILPRLWRRSVLYT